MVALSLLSLAALAAASPIKSPEDYVRAIRLAARDDPVTNDDVDNWAFYAEHATAAYCNSEDVDAGSAITCGGTCPTVEADGATILGTFNGSDTGIAAYLAVDDARGEIVFSVRGSRNIKNWISNLNFDLVNSTLVDGAQVHDGFNDAWGEMADAVSSTLDDAVSKYSDYRIIATGHSLGGAVATLGAAQFRNDGHSVDLFTYGSPRVGNGVLSDYITDQDGPEWRITHYDDPVPRLPPITFGYRHTAPEYWLSAEDASGDTYPLDQVKVCDGNDNVDCNGGTSGLDIGAHLSYFGPISDCTTNATNVVAPAPGDAQLKNRLNHWVREDIEFVKGG